MSPIALAHPDRAAVLTDRYIDALLAAIGDRRATDVPAPAELDPEVRFAARRLAVDLTRVHPSFRFEERLVGRLADGMDDDVAADEPVAGVLRPVRPIRPSGDLVRPILIGGAVTSAALSIAGAAIIAWRHGRPTRSLG